MNRSRASIRMVAAVWTGVTLLMLLAVMTGPAAASQPGQPDLKFPWSGTDYYTGGPHAGCAVSCGAWAAIDIGGSNRDILAAAGGTVIWASSRSPYSTALGNTVGISHSGGYTTWYSHLDSIAVSNNQVIPQGCRIGYMGASGSGAGGHVHLHFSITKNGSEVSIAGLTVDGWTFHSSGTQYNGTATNGGTTVTADESWTAPLPSSNRQINCSNPPTPPPTQPPPGDAVEFCDSANYGSPCARYQWRNDDEYCQTMSDFNKRAGSVRFIGNYKFRYMVTAYRDTNCDTYLAQYYDNDPDLKLLSDQFSSIRVRHHPDWVTEFYGNNNLSGRCGSTTKTPGPYIFYRWGSGSPMSGCPSDNFSARLTRTTWFDGGEYQFHGQHDDAINIFVDGVNVVGAWWPCSDCGHDGARVIDRGWHEVKVEFAEYGGDAVLGVWWYGAGALPVRNARDSSQWYFQWWPNSGLAGSPALQLQAGAPNSRSLVRDLHNDSAGWGLPSDHFSERWERYDTLACGRYRISASADDGVRVRFGDQVVNSGGTTEVDMPAGLVNVSVEWWEFGGAASVNASWSQIGSCASPPNVSAPAEQTSDEGTEHDFGLGSFADPDGNGPWHIDVDWGDGSQDSFEVPSVGSLGTLTHTYADDGIYSPAVTVADAATTTGSQSFNVTVANLDPTGNLVLMASARHGAPFVVSVEDASDPSAADTASLTFAFDCGNGLGFGSQSSEQSTTCMALRDGPVQIVRARILDKDGGETIYSQDLSLTGAPPCTEAPFTDVPLDHPFCPEIAWMKANGISTGFPDGTYLPAATVTRQAMSAFLYRYSAFTHPRAAEFGDGRDGAMPSDGNIDGPHGNAYAAVNGVAGSSTINVTDALSISRVEAGDTVLLYQARGATAGTWELNTATESFTGSGSFTVKHPLTGTFVTDGRENQAEVIRVPQYSQCDLTGTLRPPAWNGAVGGVLAIMCSGTLDVSGAIDADGTGFRGGASGNGYATDQWQGESALSPGTESSHYFQTSNTQASAQGGGAADHIGGGGGGAGYSAGSDGDHIVGSSWGAGGIGQGTADATQMCLGGGGGGGATHINPGTGSSIAGAGGGVIFVFAAHVVVTGHVSANGTSATGVMYDDGMNRAVTAGAGGGGQIYIRALDASLGTNLVTASGGPRLDPTGGTSPQQFGGGAGGDGRIAVEADDWTGSSSTTITSVSSG